MEGDVDGLRQSVAAMVTLEARLEQALARPWLETERYLEAPSVIGRLRSLVSEQLQALQAHLDGLGDSSLPALGPTISAAFAAPAAQQGDSDATGALAALRAVVLALDQTAAGYAVLHSLAHRSYAIATADLADQHRRNYLQAIRAVHWAIGDVVVQELKEAGQICQCQCPLCGPGICNCSHIHAEAQVALEPPMNGIVVRRPRPGSNAERAGLSEGDVIVAVDDQESRSYEAILERMRGHAPGEEARLRVRRKAGDTQEVVVTR